MAPLESLSNIFYFNLERFADVRVGMETALVVVCCVLCVVCCVLCVVCCLLWFHLIPPFSISYYTEVPEGEYTAQALRQHRFAQPSFFRYHHVSIAAGLVLFGFGLYVAWTQRDRVLA